MVWGAFSFHGASELIIIKGRQDSNAYVKTSKKGLLLFAADVIGEQSSCVFQQDNAPIHMSSSTRSWLSQHSVRILHGPARSRDLNIIEKV